MIGGILICVATVLQSPAVEAADQVRQALQSEANGKDSDRLDHLERAVRVAPNDARARGLMGQVAYQGRWERAEDVAQRRLDDPERQAIEREYLDRRVRTADRPDDQMKLADWCARNGLGDQAKTHYEAVLRLDSSRAAAWRHLGYRKKQGRWVRTADIVAARHEAALQKQADRRWAARLKALRSDLLGKDPERRRRAEAGLDEVTDPRAVPSIWAVFVTGGPALQKAGLRMLGRIDGPSASLAIAAMAIFDPWPEVRAEALAALVLRDPRDVAGRLIGMIRKPIRYELRPMPGTEPPGALFVEGQPFDLQRLDISPYAIPMLASGTGRLFTPDIPFDPFGGANMMMATGAWASNLLALTPHGLEPTQFAPLDPNAVSKAVLALAADPANASTILSNLQNDPYNRDIPLGYTFTLTDPKYAIPIHEIGHTTVGDRPAPLTRQQMMLPQSYIQGVQAGINNPLAPMGMAMQLKKLEVNPAHNPQNAALVGMMVQAQGMAAQQDIELGREIQRVQMAKMSLRRRLEMELKTLQATNVGILKIDARLLPVLKAVTGRDFGIDPAKWRAWWLEQLDRSPGADRAGTNGAEETATVVMRACFAIGTIARTIDGPRPIESLQAGDRVLVQEPSGGGLAFRPVLAVHRIKPMATIRISTGGASIESTGLQRFWRVGKGWTMARDLGQGDRLRTLGGVVEVTKTEKAPVQPVANIEVAGEGDLFVGDGGWLAHDFGFVPAVPEPFDQVSDEPSLTSKPLP